MDKWEITGKEQDQVAMAAEAMSAGFITAPTTYEVTNEETGDVKHVTAYSERGAGEKIAKGLFD